MEQSMIFTPQKKQNYFLSQPHQPFFLLGIVNAVTMMFVFAVNFKGILNLQISGLVFHAYSMIFLVFLNMFVGFLFITFPKFNQTLIIKKSYYVKLFYANVLGSGLFLLGSLYLQQGAVVGMVIVMITQIFMVSKLQNIYNISKSGNKSDSFWILISVYWGILGNLLFIVSTFLPKFENSAINISFYLFVIFLAFSVAQRMIPAFSYTTVPKNKNFVKIVFSLFLLTTLLSIFEFKIGKILVDFLLFAYLLREFLRWQLHPLQSPAILRVLHLALFWLPIAFLFSAVSLTAELILHTSFFFLGIHLLALGFLTTLLMGFGTRVVFGHSGLPIHADNTAIGIFYFTQMIVLARALYSVNIALGWGLDFLFDISFSAWLILFVTWGVKYGKILLFGSKTKHIVKWS